MTHSRGRRTFLRDMVLFAAALPLIEWSRDQARAPSPKQLPGGQKPIVFNPDEWPD